MVNASPDTFTTLSSTPPPLDPSVSSHPRMDTLTSLFILSFSLTMLCLSLRDSPFCRAQLTQKPQLSDLTGPLGNS